VIKLGVALAYRFSVVKVVVCAWLCFGACNQRSQSAGVERSEATSEGTRPAVGQTLDAKVQTAFELERSAYGVKLIVDGPVWTLIAAEGFYRGEGETPVVHTPAATSPPFAVMGQKIVHWRDGHLWATPLDGSAPKSLLAIEQMPRDVFASDEHFSWLERSSVGDRILVAVDVPNTAGRSGSTRAVYHSQHEIVGGAMLQDWVFFVESLPGGQWRLGAISIRIRPTSDKVDALANFGTIRNGRPPAFLMADTELYYYDGPTRSVRRVTPDLQVETTVAKGVICSPLVATARIYCAHVGGVFSVEASNEGEPSRTRVWDNQLRGPITALAANSRQLVWVEDIDGKKLRVRAIQLQ
jgi:hypothetical protein